MIKEAGAGVMQPQAEGCWQPKKLEEAQNGFSHRDSGRPGTLPTPRFQITASRIVKE